MIVHKVAYIIWNVRRNESAPHFLRRMLQHLLFTNLKKDLFRALFPSTRKVNQSSISGTKQEKYFNYYYYYTQQHMQYKPSTNFNLVWSSWMSGVPLESTSPAWAELILNTSSPNMIDKKYPTYFESNSGDLCIESSFLTWSDERTTVEFP